MRIFHKHKIIIFLIIGLTALSCKNGKLEKYTLEIKPVKFFIASGQTALLISTNLINNTSDTLKYFNMTCMWNAIYRTDKKDIRILGPRACDNNMPMMYAIAPHENISRDFYVLIKQTSTDSKTNFRIGINLINPKNWGNLSQIAHKLYSDTCDKRECTVVWSNVIGQ